MTSTLKTQAKRIYVNQVAQKLKDHPFFKWDANSRKVLNSCFKNHVPVDQCYNLILMK